MLVRLGLRIPTSLVHSLQMRKKNREYRGLKILLVMNEDLVLHMEDPKYYKALPRLTSIATR